MAFGKLYIVSTPIGNLEDITLRALRILKEVDVIAAEDTRHTLKLLNHYGITKPMLSYWGEKEKVKTEVIMEKLSDGLSVALVSDAGTPGISDPGAVLLSRAIQCGVDVVPIPGPSAHVAALSASGLPSEEFTFVGFMPPKPGQRRKKLESLATESRTLIFYEAPHRVMETMEDLAGIFGNRRAALVKELTKLYEEILRGGLEDIKGKLQTRKIAGEYVIVVEGLKRETLSLDEAIAEVKTLMKKGKGRKEAVRNIADQYSISKKELYDKSIEAS